jgi:hypothetical protein
MLHQTLTIIHRTKTLVDDYYPWFETLHEWYEKTQLPRRLIAEAMERRRVRDRIRILVNGQPLRGASDVTDARSRRITWLLPSNHVGRGDNEIVVHLDRDARAPLLVKAVSVEQDYHIAWETVRLADADPAPAAHLALTGRKKAVHVSDHWLVEQGGLLQFRLALVQPGPVNFTVQLVEGRASLWVDLWHELMGELKDYAMDQIKDAIKEAVKEKLAELREQAERAWANRDPQVQALTEDVRLLQGYLRLHELQLEPALRGSADSTLGQIIARTGDPEALVRDLFRTPASKPEPVFPEVVPVKPTRPAVVEALPPVEPAPPARAPQPPRAPARSGGGGCLIALFTMAVVVLAGLGGLYYLWSSGTLDQWQRQLAEGLKTNPATPKAQGKEAAPAIAEALRNYGAKSGEVQVTLYWANKNDLDLHVVCPDGSEIFHGRKQACGGLLDKDMNWIYEDAKVPAIENVYWPQGQAPKGNYKIYVEHFMNHGKADCQDPTAFTVRLVIRGEERFFTGQLAYVSGPQKQKVLVHEFSVD